MSYEVISQSSVKTRKKHNCWGCGQRFEVGTLMKKVNSVDDCRKLMSTYWCEICDAYWCQLKDYDSDGICMGDLLAEEDYQDFKNSYIKK